MASSHRHDAGRRAEQAQGREASESAEWATDDAESTAEHQWQGDAREDEAWEDDEGEDEAWEDDDACADGDESCDGETEPEDDLDESQPAAGQAKARVARRKRSRAELAVARRSVVGLVLAVGLVLLMVRIEWSAPKDAPWTAFPEADTSEAFHSFDDVKETQVADEFDLPAAALGRVEIGLSGSRASMERQHGKAKALGASFYESGHALRRAHRQGRLRRIENSATIELAQVSYPFAHPQSARLLRVLGEGHERACGRPLVVTSVARPRSEQPANASALSVHPAGLAFDLRSGIPAKCRSWLETKLLELEGRGLLDVTQERRPPHFHVAVFGQSVRRLSDRRLRQAMDLPALGRRSARRSSTQTAAKPRAGQSRRSSRKPTSHKVASGDSLWRIANRYGCSVEALQKLNGIKGEVIYAGQTLKLPSGR